ncbi:MAG: DUF4826 family protein [Thiohalobacteraceae bacterium]
MTDYDEPSEEERWCNDCRVAVSDYLRQARIDHGKVGEWPAWHVAPHVSMWAVESRETPGLVGWWVVAGDLPTDYVDAEGVHHPRQALKVLGARWLEAAQHMEEGRRHPSLQIGSPDDWPRLAPLLRSRAEVLLQWANDGSVWERA